VNLSEAMNRIRALLTSAEKDGSSVEEVLKKVKTLCGSVHEEDVERCRDMGRIGAEWLWKNRGGGEKKGLKVLTVCNTGSLATSVSAPRFLVKAILSITDPICASEHSYHWRMA